MINLIERNQAIEICKITIDFWKGQFGEGALWAVMKSIQDLPSAQPDNKVNLCDSCKHTYPVCPSRSTDVICGNGTGNDNICACSKYEPSAQPEPAIPLQWIEAEIEWLKSLDNAFSTLTAGQISAMVNKWKDEHDG